MRANGTIKKIMRKKKVNATVLAERLGNSTHTIYNTFKNDQKSQRGGMTFENVVRFADALGCDVIIRDRETGEEY